VERGTKKALDLLFAKQLPVVFYRLNFGNTQKNRIFAKNIVMVSPETVFAMGINAPKAHQRIISRLNAGLAFLFYREGKIDLEPLPETMIDEGQTSPVPDILLYDNKAHLTPVIIEVSHPAGVRNDFKKIQNLIEHEEYGTVEGFVFDYVNKTWRKYSKGKGEVLDAPSWSDVLKIDLQEVMLG
jgi:hypothetical protein